jgi:DNA modification methylase
MSEKIEDWTNEVHQGDVREKLQEMPEESVDMIITSPPYYGLRDYGDGVESIWGGNDDCEHEWSVDAHLSSQGGNNTEENPPDVRGNEHTQETRLRGEGGVNSSYCSNCGAWKGQLGLEPSPIQFVKNITEICNEIYRVLKPSGSFYLNLGDTYAGGGGVSGKPDDWEDEHNNEVYPDSAPAKNVDFPNKCKMLIPHRVAISLIDEGWICRNDIVWNKPNPMPESVTDRRSTKFEYIFHFVKQKDYYYDLDKIREPYVEVSKKRSEYAFDGTNEYEPGNAEGFSEETVASHPDGKNPGDVQKVTTANHSEAHFAVFPEGLIEPHIKSSCPENGVVLDPFIGSGTTAVVAEQLDRDWIGIDLNKDYVDMSYERIDNETKKIFDDRSLFDY